MALLLRNFLLTPDPRGVVIVALDVPGRPYNVLNEEVFSELQTLIAALEHDPTVRLVLFRSAKESGFLAGADLREIHALQSGETAHQISLIGQKVFDQLEHLRIPTVAAIHGPCLGGGLEFALACRYRLAQDDGRTQLGLPEVALGMLPAWGGTQRLPERVGLAVALPMIIGARKISAREAAEIGLVDEAWDAEQFEGRVRQFVSERLAEALRNPANLDPLSLRERVRVRGLADQADFPFPRCVKDPPHPGHPGTVRSMVGGRLPEGEGNLLDWLLLRAARSQIEFRCPHARAQWAVWQAVEQGVRMGRKAGLARERTAFAELLFTPECRGLLERFFQRQRQGTRRMTDSDESGRAQASAPHEQAPLARPWVEGLTIGAVLRETARRFGSRDALIFRQAGVRWTWAEFDAVVDRIARGLLALGFRRGDHFGVWATNWPEWVVLQFATARIGVVLVTINPAYRAAELQYALAQSEVRGLALIERFRSSDYFEMLRDVCPEMDTSRPGDLHGAAFPRLRWVIDMRGPGHPGMLGWRDLEAAGEKVPPARLAEAQRQLEPGDPINLQYTSGTTGLPKGALLSHRNLLLNAFFASEGQRLDQHDRICAPVPLYHCFGCVLGTMCVVTRGAALVFPHESFDAEATLEAVEAERCTAIYGVPTMFIVEMEHPSFAGRDLSSLRTGIMAGSPCPIELMKRVVKVMGAREITIAYGQTEASPLAAMTRTDDPIEKRVSTVGRPLPGIEVKIVDLLTRQELPDGRPGELCCRGHNVMLGYYNMPEATAQAIDAEGWLHTGDLGLRQPDGYFRITGRIKDTIVRGGENVAPRELEELLYQHPKVEQVSVVGVPDRRFGEEILAWIKLRTGERATAEEFREFCRAHLAHFKTPRYIKFVDGFPTTVTGKIQKYKIRAQAIKELGLRDAAAVETA